MNTPSGNIEGHLDIQLQGTDGGARVRIHSTRPLLASRLFEGKTIDQTLKTLPLLFNVCGQAQGVAAVRAIESAQGKSAGFDVERQRDRLLQLETLREHLWRVILDWPGFTGTEADRTLLAELMQQIQSIMESLDPERSLTGRPGLAQPLGTLGPDQTRRLQQTIAQGLFSCPLAEWLNFDAQALCRWIAVTDTPAARLPRHVRAQGWAGLGAIDTQAMPELADQELIERLDADHAEDFIAAPDWHGLNLETGPAAQLASHPLLTALRQRHGQGLLLRLVARLIEIARLALGLTTPGTTANRVASGLGVSQLEAARGRLCHRVVLDGGRIRRYRILAPTEWNFRTGGPAAQALAAVDTSCEDTARQQADLLIHAIDPCVSYQLTLGQA